MQMGVPIDAQDGQPSSVFGHGFNLYAGKRIAASDRRKREHVIRYMARPPIPEGALSRTDDGHLLLEIETRVVERCHPLEAHRSGADRAPGELGAAAAHAPGALPRCARPERPAPRCGRPTGRTASEVQEDAKALQLGRVDDARL